MSRLLEFSAEWEFLSEGTEEERACFAALGIQWGDVWLSEAQDGIANRLRHKPLLSAYHLAEWFATNWWRLRWEPRVESVCWRLAHRMANIGGGYAWPDITIFSDGERTALIPRVEQDPHSVFRYLNQTAAVLPSIDFEVAIDEFLNQVLERLKSTSVNGTELELLWGQVCAERSNPAHARIRKLEALLGRDPDDSSAALLESMLTDQGKLGNHAIEELAADHGYSNNTPLQSASSIESIAAAVGYSASTSGVASLPNIWQQTHKRFESRPWALGASAAKNIREQLGNTNDPLDDATLCALAAVNRAALDPHARGGAPLSFALDLDSSQSRVVLRSKRQIGRRFELSRILGDRCMNSEEPLFPATRAYTYRQKAQRAFAAELLCPFQEVFNRLQGDYSIENQTDVADDFDVSQWTIDTQLMNNHILAREDREFALAA
jgi:hypothetical protein